MHYDHHGCTKGLACQSLRHRFAMNVMRNSLHKRLFHDMLVFFHFVAPPTIDEVPNFIEVKTTTEAYALNVTYSGPAPLGRNISVLKDGSLINLTSSNDLGDGWITIEVYQKSDAGNYIVRVETVRHDGAEPPYKLTDEISFFIEVLSEFTPWYDP